MLAEEQPRIYVRFYQAIASMTQKGLLLFKTENLKQMKSYLEKWYRRNMKIFNRGENPGSRQCQWCCLQHQDPTALCTGTATMLHMGSGHRGSGSTPRAGPPAPPEREV